MNHLVLLFNGTLLIIDDGLNLENEMHKRDIMNFRAWYEETSGRYVRQEHLINLMKQAILVM